MHRFYQSIILSITNLFYWYLDYAYVAKWQLLYILQKGNPQQYVRADPHAPVVVLIPGIYETWQFMKPIAELLFAHGYSVYAVEDLGYNTGSVEEMASCLQQYIVQQPIATYSIVAHSKGGLIAKYLAGEELNRIHKIITINTPFNGSRYARFLPIKNVRFFLPNSVALLAIAKNTRANSKITSLYGLFDPHIPGGSFLKGATNIQLETRGHFRTLNDKRVHIAIINSLS